MIAKGRIKMAKQPNIQFHEGNQKWYARVTVNGKRVGVYRKRHKDVVTELNKMKRRKDENKPVQHSNQTVRKFMNEWLTMHKETIRAVTGKGYQNMMDNNILPYFGSYKLSSLNMETVEFVFSKMRNEGVSYSNLKHSKAILSTALNYAKRKELINNNPCNDIKIANDNAEVNVPKIIEESELSRILDHVNNTAPEFYAISYLASATGMRRSELCGLRLTDIDTKHGTISVSRSVNTAFSEGQSKFLQPKTKASKRTIALSNETNLFMKRYIENLEAVSINYEWSLEIIDNTAKKPERYIPLFRYSKSGTELLPDSVTKAFKRAVVDMGINDFHFHNLRHTHAGILLKQGKHPKIVQERLGHSSIQVTLDIYSHIAPNLQKDAVADMVLLPDGVKLPQW